MRRKALKGESQECWGLREASKGFWSSHRREGSQTLSTGLLGSRATLFRRISEGDVKRRVQGSGNAEGKGSSSEVHLSMAYGRHKTVKGVASGKEKTLKVALKCKRGAS